MPLKDFRKKSQSSMLRFIRYTPKSTSLPSENSTSLENNDTSKTEKSATSLRDITKQPRSLSICIAPNSSPKTNNLGTAESSKTDDSGISDSSNLDSVQEVNNLHNSVNTESSLPSQSSTNIINGSSSSSPNKLELSSPPVSSSKLFYVKPKDTSDDEDESIVDAKQSGFDISAVLTEKSCTNQNGISSQDSPLIVSRNLNTKRRIDSDDESNDGPSSKKQCQENGIDDRSSQKTSTGKNKFDDEMIERLLDTYEGIYPELDRMEIYEILEKWNFNLSEAGVNLDSIQKMRKTKARNMKMKNKMEEKEKLKDQIRDSRNDERNREKTDKDYGKSQSKFKKIVEMERRKKIWKMKAKFHVDEDNDDEEEYIGKSKVYVSDSSDNESDNDEAADAELNPARNMVLNFFNEGTVSELSAVPSCSARKAEIIINTRPFDNWKDIVMKFKAAKSITAELLNNAKDVLQMRNSIQKLMKRCEKISADINSIVSEIIDGKIEDEISKQPSILNSDLKLKNYQLIGLNWLVLMHEQQLNGVLADEMGLGKTIQAIAFLAHLKEKKELEEHLCLIVVPASTLDNWARELETWCPSLGFLVYHGAQEERRGMRAEIMNNQLEEGVHIILTTYTMVSSSTEDKGLFKRIRFHTVVFDEAHMLKNMASQRYENLMKIKCKRRLLLTGTPLQNNLVELMSILVFVMPQLFEGRKEELKKVFAMFPKADGPEAKCVYERDRIIQAKRIMAPFFLRRLKVDVLKDLPEKKEEVLKITMSERQLAIYQKTVSALKKRSLEKKEELAELKLEKLDEIGELEAMNKTPTKSKKSGLVNDENSTSNMLMKLRKIANHPLLHRSLYTPEKLKKIATILKKTSHQESVLEYIIEDLIYMSDFEIHQTCLMFGPIKKYRLEDKFILNSGKFAKFDEMLPVMKTAGDRVLIFSQFVLVLNIIEEYMKIRGHSYKRLDGSTSVNERQDLIDDFNENSDIFIFLLSTRAGGLGINLTAANVVILHDIDFNPYNDKQAEDRCHRVGQTRPVSIYRYISNNSIEEGVHQIGINKLQLEKDVTGQQEGSKKKDDVIFLLKAALGEIS